MSRRWRRRPVVCLAQVQDSPLVTVVSSPEFLSSFDPGLVSAPWVSNYHHPPFCLPLICYKVSSHVMLLAHECDSPPNHPTLTRSGLQKSHIAAGLSTVKGEGLLPHTYTQTCVPVCSKGVWCGNGDRGGPCVLHSPGGRVVRDRPG